MPTGVRDLTAISNAARLTCVQRSTVLRRVWHDFDDFQWRDQASLDPSRAWHSESLALTLRNFWGGVEANRIKSEVDVVNASYKHLYTAARGSAGERRHHLTSFLLRRAARWTEFDAYIVQGLYDLADFRPPPDLVSSLLRTFLFGWCTTTRFHHHIPAPCWFCAAEDLDRQDHYLACPQVRTWYEERFDWRVQPSDEGMHAWLFSKLRDGPVRGLQAAVATDSVFAAFEARRHGTRQSTHALLDARFKEMRRRHKQVRDAIPFSTHEIPGA